MFDFYIAGWADRMESALGHLWKYLSNIILPLQRVIHRYVLNGVKESEISKGGQV